MKAEVILGISLAMLTSVAAPAARAFPQYQDFSEKHSGRNVNCAMCHLSDDGPSGDGPGQIGSLSPADLQRLNQARTAMEPGSTVNSPILNKFGNQIIHTIGVKKFLELMPDPAKLPQALGDKSDLDGDGIPDGQEFLDGTDPLNKYHGDPIKLFFINLNRSKFELILTAIAVVFLSYGLANVVSATAAAAKAKESK